MNQLLLPTPVVPMLVDNKLMKVLLVEYQRKCQNLVEELKDVYYWCDKTAFKQEKFVYTDLTLAIKAVDKTEGMISIMGMADMRDHLPGFEDDVYVLIKSLAMRKCFSLYADIDIFSNEIKINTCHVLHRHLKTSCTDDINKPVYHHYGNDDGYANTRVFEFHGVPGEEDN